MSQTREYQSNPDLSQSTAVFIANLTKDGEVKAEGVTIPLNKSNHQYWITAPSHLPSWTNRSYSRTIIGFVTTVLGYCKVIARIEA